MKYLTHLFFFLFLSLVIYGCTVQEKTKETMIYNDDDSSKGNAAISIKISNGKAFNHPTFSIWIENMNGDYMKTLFITEAYASGIFGHQMLGDSIWLKTAGESFQPAALPYWTNKKGKINGKGLIPTPENPYTDAYTGATPKSNFIFNSKPEIKKPFRMLLEVNQAWDWNSFWTNNKYPSNEAYKHSAQPSIVYAVTINGEHESYYMNPIGHGDAKGESGKLFTQLNTISSASNIFNSIEVSLTK